MTLLNDKRTTAKNLINKFFTTHVYPYSMKKIATKFCQNVALEEFSKMSFEMLSSVLKKESVLDSTNDMLVRIIHLANWHRFDHPLISGNVDVKILLCAYMVTSRPTRVFTIMDDLAKKVVLAAKPMLECLHKTAIALAEGVSWPEVSNAMDKPLTTLLCAYLKAFKVNHTPQIHLDQDQPLTYNLSTGLEGKAYYTWQRGGGCAQRHGRRHDAQIRAQCAAETTEVMSCERRYVNLMVELSLNLTPGRGS
jgi:hypothetical protein